MSVDFVSVKNRVLIKYREWIIELVDVLELGIGLGLACATVFAFVSHFVFFVYKKIF